MISAVDAGNIWIATDTGTILKLAARNKTTPHRPGLSTTNPPPSTVNYMKPNVNKTEEKAILALRFCLTETTSESIM